MLAKCPSCYREVDSSGRGRHATCPYCGRRFSVAARSGRRVRDLIAALSGEPHEEATHHDRPKKLHPARAGMAIVTALWIVGGIVSPIWAIWTHASAGGFSSGVSAGIWTAMAKTLTAWAFITVPYAVIMFGLVTWRKQTRQHRRHRRRS
jgi:DNA-directed RNA polymerase subunit RPC12/RpoP